MHTDTETPAPMSSAEAGHIQQQLDRILASDLFSKSPQLSRFLRFCIDRVLLGRQDELKEQVLGVEVFRRSSAFDPRVDPIVRVEARRLRAKLEDYYSGQGRFDPLIIYFQRGDYVPRFARAQSSDKLSAPALSGRVVVVEDERLVARDLENRLRSLGYTVLASASSGEAAIDAAEKHHPDLVLMDIALAGTMRGTEAAKRIWQRWHIPVVYLTAFSDAMVLEDIRDAEPYGYVLKPFEPRQLHAVLQLALSRRAQEMAEVSGMREQARADALLAAIENANIEAFDWKVTHPEAEWPEAVQRSSERLLPEADDRPVEFLARVLPADRERVRAVFQRAIREKSRVEVGYRRHPAFGPATFAIASGVAVQGEDGSVRVSGLEMACSAEVVRHTRAGVAARDAAEFMSGAAGEVERAVRTVRNYLQLLEQRQRDRDAVTQSVLDEMEESTERLDAVARQVAEYASLFGNQPGDWIPVSLGDAFETAQRNVREELQDAHADVTAEDLPEVEGSAPELTRVFEILLRNAVQRGGAEARLRIGVSATAVDGEWRIGVRDNGAGFDEAESERMFRPFERSQGGGDPGADLAVAKRIVHSHGGRMGAESVAGEGSVFWFTMPMNEQRG